VTTEPGAPPRVRPPLTQRLSRRQWILLDCLAAVVTVIIMAGTVLASERARPAPHSVTVLALGLLLAAAAGVPVALRRLHPLLALEALFVLSVLLSVIQVQDGLIVVVPATYVLFTVAATSQRRTAAIALACALVTLVAEAFRVWATDSGRLGSTLPQALFLVISWGLGSAARQRRLYADGLQQQAASRAVAEERLRIARELHDVVAHGMSVIAVQAGFGEYVIDDQSAKAREALGAIQATSRDALDEMRRMLSVLRQADTAGDGPVPGPDPAIRLTGWRTWPRTGQRARRDPRAPCALKAPWAASWARTAPQSPPGQPNSRTARRAATGLPSTTQPDGRHRTSPGARRRRCGPRRDWPTWTG